MSAIRYVFLMNGRVNLTGLYIGSGKPERIALRAKLMGSLRSLEPSSTMSFVAGGFGMQVSVA